MFSNDKKLKTFIIAIAVALLLLTTANGFL